MSSFFATPPLASPLLTAEEVGVLVTINLTVPICMETLLHCETRTKIILIVLLWDIRPYLGIKQQNDPNGDDQNVLIETPLSRCWAQAL